MKKLVTKKTAAVLVFMMLVSALSPILAFAATGFSDLSYNSASGTVTGKVYITGDTYVNKDVYLDSQGRVVISVYDDAGKVVNTVYATYDQAGYYNFTGTVTSSTYLTLKYFYKNGTPVTQAVYNSSSPIFIGGGGVVTPGTVVNPDGSINGDALKALLTADKNARVEVKTDVVNLPASALTAGETLTLYKADGTSYTLPLKALKLEDLAKSLGVSLNDLIIRVELTKLSGAAEKAVADAVYAIGATPVAGAFDFKVTAVGGGKELPIEKFGQLVSRTFALNPGAVAATVTGVVYNPVTKELTFVPSTFATVDGKTIATLKRDGNSIYTVIQAPSVKFTDLLVHWAKADVTALSEKLIVEGTGKNLFEPKRNITRAEFAALIVRSLGIEATGTSEFKDVASGKWYSGAVAAAAEAGIVNGYEDGSFKPNANISRKELAAMVVRALEYAGVESKLTDAEASAALANFTDTATLGWAKGEVAAAVKAGVVQGQTATKVAGNLSANRAEAATMVYRFLTKADLID
ncbi:S-layer homology domain-containing protein [Paenibacillus beijingensis]|uniref:SLH domain-containing protein n=1 Tax=Paenibacillus beijingensis TaxID=1126833 RepID=A0A0D5NGV2_9BACL|nr:S-layer homology domain-containing protein [Paenibacillus beijingensis]AJY74609.1 hypothetical protein VN24_08500 [Paenibacillus beijingensis]